MLRRNKQRTPEQLDLLYDEFSILVASGRIRLCNALTDEVEHLDLPRLAFKHTRRQLGLVRAMIDRINGFADTDATVTAQPVDDAGVA